MAISHANCTHPRTPAGRRACRNQSTTPPSGWSPEAEAHHEEVGRRNQGIGEAMRKRAQKPVRIQPRRGGARVSANGSACVQAALHIDAHGGRCACGWEANAA